MMKAWEITLSQEERATLNIWLRLHADSRLAMRARIILLAADGKTTEEIAVQLHASRKTVHLWQNRFLESRLAGIEKEAPRNKKRTSKAREKMERLIIQKTTKERPTGASRWSIRLLAKELGISPSMVHRVWKANGLNS